MKVSAGIYASNLIPGDNVTDALGDLQVAMWANPGFAIVCIRTDAGLRGVFDSAFDFRSSQAKTHGV